VNDLLLPATDAGVFGQLLLVLALAVGAGWLVRRERALVTLVVGVATVLLGALGVRALH